MYQYYLPEEYHQQAKEYLSVLSKQAATEPIFKRLMPFHILPDIAALRLAGYSCYAIANQLELSLKVIKRRDTALTLRMKQSFPELYQAWSGLLTSTEQPKVIQGQAERFKHWLTELLNLTQAPCIYCQSINTVRIGQRLTFRCRQCRRTFNQLKPYHLHLLSHQELWLDFIELLLGGETNQTITRTLGINVSTVAKWRSVFLYLMGQQGFELLADWIKR